MVASHLRRVIRRAGLTGVARRALLFVAGGERAVTLDGVEATFEQRDFGDYIELNQIGPEREVLRRMRTEVAPDDVFLDVGSNLGTYAVFLGDAIDDGTVIAVEPVPSTADKLARNLARNDIRGTVCRVAFSDEAGAATMTVPDAHGSSSLARDGHDEGGTDDGPDGDGPTVERVRGDDYLVDHDLPHPTVVKVDVEGHEPAAIRGLETTLSRPACRLVYCEVHDVPDPGPAGRGCEAGRLLDDLGFDVAPIASLPGDRHVLRAESGGPSS